MSVNLNLFFICAFLFLFYHKEFCTSTSSTSTSTSTHAPTVNEEWGGNCTDKDWEKCSHLKKYFSKYWVNATKSKKAEWKFFDIDCKIQPILCLKNGWSVNRCQILCMGKCNKGLLSRYDDYVVKEGQCSVW